MLIRAAQIKVFEDAAFDEFVAELCRHCKEYSPDLINTLSDEQLDEAVRKGIDRAKIYGFTNRGPIRFFIEMMIAFGSGFDSDPQYPWAAETLAKHEDAEQMALSDELFQAAIPAFGKVFGEDALHSNNALKAMLDRLKSGIEFKRENFKQDMLRLLKEIHPIKSKEVGDDNLMKLIRDGIARGNDRYGFKNARSMALMVLMKFALGHNFDTDPFHPWISSTMKREVKESPDELAQELERRALPWFEAVLKKAEENA